MKSRWFILRLLFSGAAVAVISFLALRGSPWVSELPWIPDWVGEWADRNGNLRNLPAFAGLTLVLVLLFAKGSMSEGESRKPSKDQSLRSKVDGGAARGRRKGSGSAPLSDGESGATPERVTRLRVCRMILAAGAAALLAIGLEFAQVFIAGRHFDWADIGWSLLGVALVAVPAAAAAASRR